MAKIGRNDPCPCGSGKKYKKCCQGKGVFPSGAPATVTAAMPPNVLPPAKVDAPPPVPPYTLARAFENSAEYLRMKRRHPKRAARYCTPGTLAQLSSEELLARLAKLGVDASREAYLACAQGHTSAWAIGEQWQATIQQTLSPYQEDFVALGACELWKRYLPERPSIEMLDDWMAAGYERLARHDSLGACECWLPLWEHLHSRLLPEMRTLEATQSVFNGGEHLYNWVQDFVLELHNAAADDRRFAEHGGQLCQAVLAQFPDEDALFRLNFRADLGEFLYMLGEDEAGEQVMLALMRDHPDCAAGYARLAEILGYGPTRERGPIDVPRAIELLERALARPVDDADDYDLTHRLHELKAQTQGAAPSHDHDTERATGTAKS